MSLYKHIRWIFFLLKTFIYISLSAIGWLSSVAVLGLVFCCLLVMPFQSLTHFAQEICMFETGTMCARRQSVCRISVAIDSNNFGKHFCRLKSQRCVHVCSCACVPVSNGCQLSEWNCYRFCQLNFQTHASHRMNKRFVSNRIGYFFFLSLSLSVFQLFRQQFPPDAIIRNAAHSHVPIGRSGDVSFLSERLLLSRWWNFQSEPSCVLLRPPECTLLKQREMPHCTRSARRRV